MKQWIIIVLLAVLVGAAVGREWSEPIRLTNHFGDNLYHPKFSVEIDPTGGIHLLYWLTDINGEAGNSRVLYCRYSTEGGIIEGPLDLFSELDLQTELPKMILDRENECLHIVVLNSVPFENEGEYVYCCIDYNADYIVEPTVLEGLSRPWYVDEEHIMYPASWGNGPGLALGNNGELVFECLDSQYDGDSRVYFLSYTRFTQDGQIVDSTHVLGSYDMDDLVRGYPLNDHFTSDTKGNLYFLYRIIRHRELGGNQAYMSKVDADDNIVEHEFRLPRHDGRDLSQGIVGIVVDNQGNNYTILTENSEDGQMFFLRKINPDSEIEFDRIVGLFNVELARITFTLSDSTISIVYPAYPDGPNGEFLGYISFDLTGAIVDSMEYLPIENVYTGYAMRIRIYEGQPFYFYSWMHRIDNNDDFEIMMVHETPLEVEKQVRKGVKQFELLANYPNPFNNNTTISFYLDRPGQVGLRILTITAEEVWHHNFMTTAAGSYSLSWNGIDIAGRPLPSGFYFVQLTDSHGKIMAARKICLVK